MTRFYEWTGAVKLVGSRQILKSFFQKVHLKGQLVMFDRTSCYQVLWQKVVFNHNLNASSYTSYITSITSQI